MEDDTVGWQSYFGFDAFSDFPGLPTNEFNFGTGEAAESVFNGVVPNPLSASVGMPDGFSEDVQGTFTEVSMAQHPEWTFPGQYEPITDPSIVTDPKSDYSELSGDLAGEINPDATTTLDSNISCTCVACLGTGTNYGLDLHSRRDYCRILGCDWSTSRVSDLVGHERRHFGEAGSFTCPEKYCKFTTKRWSDFTRHYTGKHCANPPKFLCSVPWCKFSNSGFARKDKLKSHYENVHKGYAIPSAALRVIKPAQRDVLSSDPGSLEAKDPN